MSQSNTYRYTVIRKQHSSAVYGPCEVCGHHAAEVHHQTEQRRYTRSDGSEGWTNDQCSDRFGHLTCLKGIQRDTEQVAIAA
jgi:hypothetical protein